MSHADEARRIAPPESYGTLCNEIAAALAAAERRGIERLRPALEQFDIDYYCEEGQPESEACRYAPSVLADAIRALLPAEPAAKCPTCAKSGNPGYIVSGMEAVHAPPAPMVMLKTWKPCPSCAGGGS